MPVFNHHELALLKPAFDSPLVDVLTELEHLRRLVLKGTTPAPIFFQLKNIFHILESLGSARIEGNHTTLADYVESRIEGRQEGSDHLREIANIEAAMDYIETHFHAGDELTEHFIRELHAMTVSSLVREGDKTPGAYRVQSVHIAQSGHLPPEPVLVAGYMGELVAFINEKHPPKYDLIKVALAHHRFGWIHPFSNGNGRVVRLLTYALLVKYGFNVKASGRLLNPTAVFCNDRDKYYAMLEQADTGTAEALENWCVYVLQGILDELRKLDRLADFSYLRSRIFEPALAYARERELITPVEKSVLMATVMAEGGVVKSSGLSTAMAGMNDAQRTYQIRKLVERNMLQPVKPGSRQYTISFVNNYLLRGIVNALSAEGFIPATLEWQAGKPE